MALQNLPDMPIAGSRWRTTPGDLCCRWSARASSRWPRVWLQTKPDIALAQIRSLVDEDVPRGVVLADAAYGGDGGFREGLVTLGLCYAVGIQSSTALWPPGILPLPPRPKGKTGRPPQLLRRDEQHQPLSAKDLALCLSAGDWRRVSWREGTRGMMRSRFASLRVRVARRDYGRKAPHPEQWLLIEWPATEKEPTRYWLSNLPASITLRKLVAIAKLRWRIERDHEELKQKLGRGHFEGRNGRGFHHQATLSIAAYGFLVFERCLFPPPAMRGNSKQQRSRFPYPICMPATRPEVLPVRTERHNPQSIATLRRQIATHLARSLPRCPCYLRQFL
jgi:SRSO17 transposase